MLDCLCPSVPECERNVCPIKFNSLVGSVTTTYLKSDSPSLLYCFRIHLSNCNAEEICNSLLFLNPVFKYDSATVLEPNVFQTLIENLLANPADLNISLSSNIAGATLNPLWNGGSVTQVFENPVSIMPGSFIVELCIEIPISVIETELGAPCLLPAIFESFVWIRGTDQDTGCPFTNTASFHCYPNPVSIA